MELMRILLADDHRLMRDGLRAILERAGMEIVGEADNGHQAHAMVHDLWPQVVVMDVCMPELNGVDATRRLVADLPGIKVIGLSMHSDRRYVVAMFQAGAVGYLLKHSAGTELLQAVEAVATGLTYVSPAIAASVIDGVLTSSTRITPDRPLSLREREVLQLLAEGKSSKDIANTLHLALPTVDTHRRQIMDKVGLRSVAELTKYAIREGLTSVE
jgi:DNA-binding NarL/FixJ family response regulator